MTCTMQVLVLSRDFSHPANVLFTTLSMNCPKHTFCHFPWNHTLNKFGCNFKWYGRLFLVSDHLARHLGKDFFPWLGNVQTGDADTLNHCVNTLRRLGTRSVQIAIHRWANVGSGRICRWQFANVDATLADQPIT